ncbi:MAG: hypothetical protein HOW73_36655 [Polyangiaceae bacterium]|nr:hypothetical protein [Polyangiaceae bacterium]
MQDRDLSVRMGRSCSLLVAALAIAACSAGSSGSGAGDNNTGGTSAGGSSQGGAPGTGGVPSEGGTTGQFVDGPGGGTPGNNCNPEGPDFDQDGFTIEAGDCNDCDPNVNPGAIEVIGAPPDGDGGAGGAGEYIPADEDCDGTADNVAGPCDDALALEGTLPMDAARAIELCKVAESETDWGVVSANYTRANGTPTSANAQFGILESFGTNVPPRAGARVIAMSSGTARLPGQAGACTYQSCTINGPGTPPSGFPQAVPGCDVAGNINDDIALDLTLRAPTNATGYKFAFKFTSFEYPEWVCSDYNDQFIALVNPPPAQSQNGNISFDSQGNPVSVNIAFFDVCAGCAAGTNELAGTGFDTGFGSGGDAGGTTWLQTQAPIEGGSTFSIRFAIWDTADSNLDSTTVIDAFEWIADGGTVDVGTTPAPPQ